MPTTGTMTKTSMRWKCSPRSTATHCWNWGVHGVWLMLLAAAGFHITGVDISPALLAGARQKVQQERAFTTWRTWWSETYAR